MTRRARMGPLQSFSRPADRMAPGGRGSAAESPVRRMRRLVGAAGEEPEVPPEPPVPYGLHAGPWQASRSGYVCHKNPTTIPDPAAYKYPNIPPLYTSGTNTTRPFNLGCYYQPTPGTGAPNVNDYGSTLIMDARVSGVDSDYNRGLEIFGTDPNRFWAWNPSRDSSFSTHPVSDEWNANPDIVGWEMEDRCVFIEASRLPGGSSDPINTEWASGGGRDLWTAYTGITKPGSKPTDPRAFTDAVLSGFTFTSVVEYRGSRSGASGFPAGYPITYQISESAMLIYTGNFGVKYGCPPNVRYTGTALPAPPTSGANVQANYTVSWAPNDLISALYIGWSVSAPSQSVPASTSFSAYALSLTAYGNAPAQVMASVTQTLRWRWLYVEPLS